MLRYLLQDIPEQFEQATDYFEMVRTGRKKMVLLESVLTECIYILTKHYNVPRKEAAEALAGILQYRGALNRIKRCFPQHLSGAFRVVRIFRTISSSSSWLLAWGGFGLRGPNDNPPDIINTVHLCPRASSQPRGSLDSARHKGYNNNMESRSLIVEREGYILASRR